VALALFKIGRFLEHGLRLRTACDLMLDGAADVTRPAGFAFPGTAAIEAELPGLISAVARAGHFNDPPVTVVRYEKA
jgi:CRISPR-associated protein Csb1